MRFSVIIPVSEDCKSLARCLSALANQTFNGEWEALVIDNGVTDLLADDFPQKEFVLLREKNYLNSPYSARNRGLEVAKGEIIIFLDATCVPIENWLNVYDRAFDQDGHDLIGGGVRFNIDEKSGLGEVVDSLRNIQMEDSIKKGHSKTANLAVRREAIDQLGPFEEGLRSGGDVRWTKKATNTGLSLVYLEDATVTKDARDWQALLVKEYRVGKGSPSIWREDGVFMKQFVKHVIIFFVPPNPKKILLKLSKREYSFLGKRSRLAIIGLIWRANIQKFFGILSGL